MTPLDYQRTQPDHRKWRRRQLEWRLLRLNLGVFLTGLSVMLLAFAILRIYSAPPAPDLPRSGSVWEHRNQQYEIATAGVCALSPLSLVAGVVLLLSARRNAKSAA